MKYLLFAFLVTAAPAHALAGAGGAAARSDNGGGSHRGKSGRDALLLSILGAVILIRMVFFLADRNKRAAQSADQLLDDEEVSGRSSGTLTIIKSLAAGDPEFEPGALEGLARDIFMKVQRAWQAQDYDPVRGLMAPELYKKHCDEVNEMKARGQVDILEDLKVLRVDFVRVYRPEGNSDASFTALITASAKSYILNSNIDFKSTADTPVSTFQEFWTFSRTADTWRLSAIDQTNNLDILRTPNLPDKPAAAPAGPPPPPQPAAAYAPGAAALAAGGTAVGAAVLTAAVAPAQPAAVPQPSAARQEDPRWNTKRLEIAATLAFENVYEAWAGNDSSRLKPELLSAETLAKITRLMAERKAEGLVFEFRNFMIRQAEVLLTSPAGEKGPLDQFTARITAIAASTMTRNGKQLYHDAAPSPFTEYWALGRQEEKWKLLDILPRASQENAAAGDGAPTPAQIEWYWDSENAQPISRTL
jgi:predicted lipid-binding transport protein (Tim44 family)